MCGFVVMVQRHGPPDMERLAEALAALRHRGPDASGIARIDVGGEGPSVGLAHARLAIVDLDARSHQPFRAGGHALVYNGELYDHADHARGMALSTTGDTEVALNLLRAGGVAALGRANGMWALAWLDAEAGRLTAARDAYGKKPLFYIADERGVVLASEIGALLAAAGRRPIADPAALAGFVASGWAFPDSLGGTTHLPGVREVRPGHALEIDLRGWRISERRALGLDTGGDGPPPDDAALPELLADAVGRRLVGERRLGLMLSGGVDSTLILSVLAARGWLDRVLCLTGDAGKSEDAAYARACAEAVGARAVTLPLDYGAAGVDHFIAVCRHQEKPFPLIGNVLGLHALYAAMQREGVTVALDGTGADEIFGGYWRRQAGFAVRDAARDGDHAWLRGIAAGGMLPAEVSATAGGAPMLEGLGAHEAAHLSAEGLRLVAGASHGDPLIGFEGSLRQAMARDATAGRLQEWLWQNDRTAMAAGIENRSPFLDERLACWIAADRRAKFDGALNKPTLRRLFRSFRPMPSMDRTDKQGFRWVHGRFVRRNAAALLGMMAASRVMARFVAPGPWLDALRADPALLEGRLAQRLLTLAGLEAAGRLADAG